MAAIIGIKIANGEFFSIVEENSSAKKRLILTTVHDKQSSVQIDLYKSYTKTMADAMYIGSLVVENIKLRPKGEPSIEMIISSGEDGNINADAWDTDPTARKEHQYLNVSLKSLDEDNRDYEIPDFELEAERPPLGLYGKAEAVKNTGKNRSPWLVVIIAALVLIVICLGLWIFLWREKTFGPIGSAQTGRSGQPAASVPPQQPAEPAAAPQPAPEPVPAEPAPAPAAAVLPAEPLAAAPAEPAPAPAALEPVPASPPPVIQAPAQAPAPVQTQRTRPVPPVRSYRVPATIPQNGAPYTIRWGDTLWDIAEAFYRNPWLYPRIARFNNIRNPDWIISGTVIRIPPRN